MADVALRSRVPAAASVAASSEQAAGDDFHARARGPLTHLRRTAAALLVQSCGRSWQEHGPSELARRLDVDVKLAWKIRHVATADDVLAAVRYVPGRAAAERLSSAARAAGGSSVAARRFVDAVARFREFSREQAGGIREMRLLAARHAEAADPGDEAERRRAAFDAYAYATGLRSRALWFCSALLPNDPAKPSAIGLATIRGRFGMQRLRGDVGWRVVPSYRYDAAGPVPAEAPVRPLEPALDPRRGPSVVERFCTQPTPQWRAEEDGAWRLLPGEAGERGEADVVLGERFAATEPVRADEPLINSFQVSAAAEVLVVDQLVHRSLLPLLGDAAPTPRIVLTDGGSAGGSEPDVPTSLVLRESQLLQAPGLKCRHVARATEMAQHLLHRCGETPSDFVAYRLVLPWPMYATACKLTWPRQPK